MFRSGRTGRPGLVARDHAVPLPGLPELHHLMSVTLRRACLRSLLCATAFPLASCVEEYGLTGSASSSSGASSGREEGPLTQHDVALRFLTAYIRLDRTMALKYATPQAVSKLNWNLSHRGNIPYYDDKMLLQFNGGWARVFFQKIGGTYMIVDFEVHGR